MSQTRTVQYQQYIFIFPWFFRSIERLTALNRRLMTWFISLIFHDFGD